MVLPLIPPSPREDHHSPPSPGLCFYLPDFDPLTGWLLDPDFHSLPIPAAPHGQLDADPDEKADDQDGILEESSEHPVDDHPTGSLLAAADDQDGILLASAAAIGDARDGFMEEEVADAGGDESEDRPFGRSSPSSSGEEEKEEDSRDGGGGGDFVNCNGGILLASGATIGDARYGFMDGEAKAGGVESEDPPAGRSSPSSNGEEEKEEYGFMKEEAKAGGDESEDCPSGRSSPSSSGEEEKEEDSRDEVGGDVNSNGGHRDCGEMDAEDEIEEGGDVSSNGSHRDCGEMDAEDEIEEGGDVNSNGSHRDCGEMDAQVEIEEGEIIDSTREDTCASGEDEDAVVGPIRSRNQIEDHTPVRQVEVCLERHDNTLPVGVISSIMGTRIIVKGLHQHSPLNEGSVLWITETRLPLGTVDEIFGPVKFPYYVVRYNNESEVPVGVSVGTAVSFDVEFANYTLNGKDLYKMGYDASGEYDEEVFDGVEFSDDEVAAEYRRFLRQTKRAASSTGHRDQETAFGRKADSKVSPLVGRCTNREFATDKRMEKFDHNAANDRWSCNHESAFDKSTVSDVAAASDRLNRNQQYMVDRTNFKGAPARNCKPHGPRNKPILRNPYSSRVPLVNSNFGTGNHTHSFGSENTILNTPAIAPAILKALQLVNSFGNPAFQLLSQQTNASIPHGFPPEQQNMSSQGGGRMNVPPSQQLGNATSNYQQNNNFFNPFPDAMSFQQQFISNLGTMQFTPYTGSTLLGSLGQSNFAQGLFGFSSMQEQGVSGSRNPSQGRPVRQTTTARALLGQGVSGSCNAKSCSQPPQATNQGIYPVQSGPFNCPTSVASAGHSIIRHVPFGCSNKQKRGSSGSCSSDNYRPRRRAVNSSNCPLIIRPVGQSSIGQVPFRCTNMEEQGSSGSCNVQSNGQPMASNDQGRMHPPVQFNPGRPPSSFRGKKRYRGGRHFYQRGG